MDTAGIFDSAALRLRRARAARRSGGDFLRRHIADELIERLAIVRRSFADVLCLRDEEGRLAEHFRALGASVACAAPDLAGLAASGTPVPAAAYDLVVSPGGLDVVDDLPGTLALIRRALRPDGLFLGGFVGAGSLPRLRAAMLAADLATTGGATPRIHPQIDVRAAGDLLARAGFALPVADGEPLDVRYASLSSLVADLRAAGATNVLHDRRPLTRQGYATAVAAFAAGAEEDGRVTEQLAIVYLSGWAPSPDQPRPAARGSGTQSLAAALRRKR